MRMRTLALAALALGITVATESVISRYAVTKIDSAALVTQSMPAPSLEAVAVSHVEKVAFIKADGMIGASPGNKHGTTTVNQGASYERGWHEMRRPNTTGQELSQVAAQNPLTGYGKYGTLAAWSSTKGESLGMISVRSYYAANKKSPAHLERRNLGTGPARGHPQLC